MNDGVALVGIVSANTPRPYNDLFGKPLHLRAAWPASSFPAEIDGCRPKAKAGAEERGSPRKGGK